MYLTILAAGLHYLALGIGLGALFARGTHFRGLKRTGSDKREELKSLLMADSFWGLAALLWIASGLWRVFGGVEKAPDFYLHNPLFWIKIGLFAAIFALEIFPMVTLIQWRLRLRKEWGFEAPQGNLRLFARLNDLEVALLVLIPFVAAAMTRGVWLTP